ncbi:DUF4126 domain-containing protein [Sphingobacterium bovistauri]|uniref:DUF4126 domain-containing protein n=1 Tax=Sphingobacterium bovistauri TaxID=2781959 RepID=A0ABS7Z521_9SPHI|nr:DUF4126 domain-containing protein [Sphingobacterium bovistauri]MCA5005270.1 DUF4126 domain-containing protein [Sphingobacterium bovistauri]
MGEIGSYLLSVFIGIGLASATGFRVFLPLFFVSLASYFNWIPMQEDWIWLASLPALIVLGVAMLFEILAYYIPFVDNIMDSIAIPLSAIAGTVLFSSQFAESNEILKWGLGIIAGGGTAATISTALSGLRVASSTSTGGLGNSVVSTVENTGATLMSVLAVFLPILATIITVVILYYFFRFGRKIWNKNSSKPSNSES